MLSNSYSAEYGGLAGVVVTTKRGSVQYRGTGVLRLQQRRPERAHLQPDAVRRRARRSLSDTHERRWGASLGGPLIGRKLFFYGNYEGLERQGDLRRRSREAVPTAAMRAGDFRGTSIHPKDPLTGEPFPDQVIPADRIDPAATKIMNFFYPLPNQGIDRRDGGYGVFQQFVPETRKRQRADLRLDTEAIEERLPVRPRKLPAPRSRPASRSRRATRSRTCPSSTRSSTRRR